MTLETSVVYDVLGIDVDELEWQDLAMCAGQPINLFFDDYETNPRKAKIVDQMCASCPVRNVCLQAGVDSGETGVWGGVYLINGRADDNKNSHKESGWKKRLFEDDDDD